MEQVNDDLNLSPVRRLSVLFAKIGWSAAVTSFQQGQQTQCWDLSMSLHFGRIYYPFVRCVELERRFINRVLGIDGLLYPAIQGVNVIPFKLKLKISGPVCRRQFMSEASSVPMSIVYLNAIQRHSHVTATGLFPDWSPLRSLKYTSLPPGTSFPTRDKS